MYRTIPALLVAVGLLVACGADDGDSAAGQQPTDTPDEHVWQDQVDALDKAQQTQDVLLEAQKARSKQLDDDG